MEKNFTQIKTISAASRLGVKHLGVIVVFIFLLINNNAFAQNVTPTITAVNPECTTAGRPDLPITITGTLFDTGANDVRIEVYTANNTDAANLLATYFTTATNTTTINYTLPSGILSQPRILYLRVGNRVGGSDNFTRSNQSRTLTVTPSVGPITATRNDLCGGGEITYTVPALAGATSYAWSIPTTATVIGPSNTNEITLQYSNTTIISPLFVSAVTPCGTSSASFQVRIKEEVFLTAGDIIIDTDDPDDEVIAGEPVTFIAQSEIIDAGDIFSAQWFTSTDDGATWTSEGTSTFPTFTLLSAPENLTQVRVFITPQEQNVCYENLPDDGFLEILSQPIVPLPVELLYFTAVKRGTDVAMEWATASELNNKGFEVQVSLDGQNFRSLGFVDSKVNTTSLKQLYTFVDREKGKLGTRYYRLKQVDLDGKFEYFSTKAVEFGAITANSIKAYPNPFHSELQLNIDSEATGDVQLTVTNTMGQQLMQRTIRVERGANTEKLELDPSLPRGIYIVSTTMGGFKSQFKLMKE
ncbi:T9SS type A sorting domain-containing protein [uncultured Pontibacter sp.]|uniref:T9SS type A sorting domain-containing protein n=1 Tax=uncultured Pontibacter sp. TaxID=453356 RepID=UPI002625EC31|nr:T9SS type A sorting domain-containing protein [uncultured Pontibacter sp.]